LFRIENTCICGQALGPLANNVINISTSEVDEDSRCVLLGYPGLVSNSAALTLKPDGDKHEAEVINQEFVENKLIYTEGTILKSTNLIAITNSSAAGMSGSPLLIKKNGQWKVIGILIGGPAVLAIIICYN
jgi:hypothetical protein